MSGRHTQTYEQRNKGKKLFKYRITRPGAKVWRMEQTSVDGKAATARVCYGAPDATVPGIRDVITLTAEGAARLAHMRLVPIDSGAPSVSDTAPDIIIVPDDWASSLSKNGKLTLASRIAGKRVTEIEAAEAIITEMKGGAPAAG